MTDLLPLDSSLEKYARVIEQEIAGIATVTVDFETNNIIITRDGKGFVVTQNWLSKYSAARVASDVSSVVAQMISGQTSIMLKDFTAPLQIRSVTEINSDGSRHGFDHPMLEVTQ